MLAYGNDLKEPQSAVFRTRIESVEKVFRTLFLTATLSELSFRSRGARYSFSRSSSFLSESASAILQEERHG